jgi:hypothetical protein
MPPPPPSVASESVGTKKKKKKKKTPTTTIKKKLERRRREELLDRGKGIFFAFFFWRLFLYHRRLCERSISLLLLSLGKTFLVRKRRFAL